MRLIRSFTAAVIAVSLVLPATALAGTSTSDLGRQILALKHQMEMQQRTIDRLEHRFAGTPVKIAKKRHARVVAHRGGAPAIGRSAVGFASSPISEFANQAGGAPSTAYASNSAASTQSTSTGSLGKEGPAQGSVQSVYEQQNALFAKGLTITPGINYTYGDNRFFTLNGFMALGAIFLGNINVSRQQNTVVTPNVNLSYGATKRLQFDMTVPFEMRESRYSSAGAQNSSQQITEANVKNAGIGDINAGFFYQLPQKKLNGPIVVLNGHVTAPTGSEPYGIKVVQDANNDNLSYVKALPTGAGVWGVSAGASIIKTVDPAILFAGATVFYNIQRHFADISPYEGTTTPGTVAPGSALSLNIGTAFSLNDRMSATFGFQDTIVGSERLRADNGPWQTVGGSSVNAAVFNIGTTYAVNHRTSWQAMLGIGVTHDAPSFQLSMRFPHGPGQ